MNIGGKIIHFSILPSTNDLARELAIKGEAEGTVVLADEQTCGRGTKGRSWFSAAGLGLYASIILRPQKTNLSLLPLAMGLAVREALAETFQVEIVLKWPNDIIFNNKKIGGLLLESGFLGPTPNYAILGIGINLNHQLEDFPEELREKAGSLRLACGRPIQREDLLFPLWQKISYWYKAFIEGKDEAIIETFESHHLFKVEEQIVVKINDQQLEGRFKGFNPEGVLILLTSEGERLIASGDLILKKGGANAFNC